MVLMAEGAAVNGEAPRSDPVDRRTTTALAATIAVLAAFNVVRTLLVPESLGIVANLATAVLVVAIARWARLGADELGLQRDRWTRGLAYGGAFAGAMLAVLLVMVALPGLRSALDDDRVHIGAGALLFQVLVEVPLGTVVLEELAFRGSLLGLLCRRWSIVPAAVGSSVLFGLWHIGPALQTAADNKALGDLASSPRGLALTAAGTVLATTIAGLFFSWLRVRAQSLLAPAIAHLAINSLTFTVAWTLAR